ncbi:MAG: hypothetical protein ACRC5H_05730 [Treponemataceae bacterium]
MFDNILHQHITSLLKEDVIHNRLPQSLLFSGKIYSGKLTTALELARILSCEAAHPQKALWECQCHSCHQHKLLLHPSILILGRRECSLEIAASSKTFLKALENKKPYTKATLYLFIRSIRKLTCRFNTTVLEGDEKASKIASLLSDITEILEELDIFLSDSSKNLDFSNKVEKKINTLIALTQKLENNFLTSNFPIDHIRKITAWCHLKSMTSKKIIIFENAEKMQEGSRNALLKILEEPPVDTIFIFITTNKAAIMPTIVSRMRNYAFCERTIEQQKNILSRLFHVETATNFETFFSSFLSISPEIFITEAKKLLNAIYINQKQYVVSAIYTIFNKFEQKTTLKYFLQALLMEAKNLMQSNQIPSKVKYNMYAINKHINVLYEQIMIFNLSPLSALDLFIFNLQQNQQGRAAL